MHLAKLQIDFGLNTNNVESHLEFWRQVPGVRFDHMQPIRRGVRQYRHDIAGSVLKINRYHEPLPAAAAAGYCELLIASSEIAQNSHLKDPDGNRVCVVPIGTDGVTQAGMRIRVRSVAAHRRFFVEGLGLTEQSTTTADAAFGAGDSVLLLDEDADASQEASIEGPGWRYISLQVHQVDTEHRRVLQHGGREGLAPVTLGNVARISMVRDPDGNWIELSQRASLVGSLE